MTAAALPGLLRQSVLDVGPYRPGASGSEMSARFGGREMIRLKLEREPVRAAARGARGDSHPA